VQARADVVDEGDGTYTVTHTFDEEGEFEVRRGGLIAVAAQSTL
jgi:hypothetical protein